MKSLNRLVLATAFAFSLNSGAATLEGVTFPDTHKTADGEELVLNGLGLRKVVRFGLTFEVYVAGLYLKEKQADPAVIGSSKDTQFLKLQFVRKVSRKDMVKAWRESLRKSCKEECEVAKEGLKEFNKTMVNMKKGSTVSILFKGDKTMVDVDGRSKKSATISGMSFRKNLMNIYMGPKPPNKELKSGLLGK